MAYGLGAAVVILGALFKLMHWPGAGPMLIIGLGAEAAIFALSAFEPLGEELDWSLVYPELSGGASSGKKGKDAKPEDAQGLLSQKLDTMLKDAKLDANLMSSLSTSIPMKKSPNPASAKPSGLRRLSPPVRCMSMPIPINGKAKVSTFILKPIIATNQPVMVVPILEP